MRTEIPRQIIHFLGLMFVIFAQFVSRELTIFYFAMITVSFFLYSWYIRTQQSRMIKILHNVETKFRSFTLGFERSHVKNPFTGSMLFYLGFTLTFIAYPLPIASAACAMLAVGDSLSTLVGLKFGKHKIGKKSIEGSFACFVGSLIIGVFFVSPFVALVGAIVATFAELIPRIDDNLTIPLLSG